MSHLERKILYAFHVSFCHIRLQYTDCENSSTAIYQYISGLYAIKQLMCTELSRRQDSLTLFGLCISHPFLRSSEAA